MKQLNCPFKLESSWQEVLENELQNPYIQKLNDFVANERARGLEIFPPENLVFNAFDQAPFHKVNVLIMGQDPYHGPGQAHGLCFSVPNGVRPPPSLQNIFKELRDDLGLPVPSNGCLMEWAKQGVLMLNATLTVRRGEPLSHQKKGWEQFTDAVVASLAARQDPLVFVLWGKAAKEKLQKADLSRHCVLEAAHPSPLSAYNGFFGCKHFSKINAQLEKWKKKPIKWAIS